MALSMQKGSVTAIPILSLSYISMLIFLSHCFREYIQYGSWGMLFFHSNSITVTNPSWVAGALFMAWFFSANPLAGIEEMWKYYSGWRHFNLTFIMWQWLLAIDTTRKSIFDQFYNYAAINLYLLYWEFRPFLQYCEAKLYGISEPEEKK